MNAVEKRQALRAPARLRPGKLLSEAGAFIGDCAITDRSRLGVRVGVFEAPQLPPDMMLFDEGDRRRRPVRLVWQAGTQAGLSFEGGVEDLDAAEIERISGRYYALS